MLGSTKVAMAGFETTSYTTVGRVDYPQDDPTRAFKLTVFLVVSIIEALAREAEGQNEKRPIKCGYGGRGGKWIGRANRNGFKSSSRLNPPPSRLPSPSASPIATLHRPRLTYQ